MIGSLQHVPVPSHQQIAAVHDPDDRADGEAGAENSADAIAFLEGVRG